MVSIIPLPTFYNLIIFLLNFKSSNSMKKFSFSHQLTLKMTISSCSVWNSGSFTVLHPFSSVSVTFYSRPYFVDKVFYDHYSHLCMSVRVNEKLTIELDVTVRRFFFRERCLRSLFSLFYMVIKKKRPIVNCQDTAFMREFEEMKKR